MMTKLNFFEKRPIMDTIGFSIKFINQNFTHLFKSIIVIYLPLYFLLGVLFFVDNEWFTIVIGGWYAWLGQTIRSEIYENVQVSFPIHYIMISLIYQAVSGAFISSVFYSYFILYNKKDINFGIKDLFSEMGKNIWTLMSLNAVITVVMFVTVFFFTRIIMLSFLAESEWVTYAIGLATISIIVYFLIRMIFLQILVVAEETNLIAGVERSIELIKNNWWRVFGVVLAPVLVVLGFVLVLGILSIVFPEIMEFIIYMMWLGRAWIQVSLTFSVCAGFIIQFLTTLYWKTNLFAIYASLYEGKEYKKMYQDVNKLGKKERDENSEDF
ncbi:MAG: hypothetical protein MUC49_16090 [Raineya sp.]|jgi:hypothetical protein|nr:hypothetical protein [Raineya sp.]